MINCPNSDARALVGLLALGIVLLVLGILWK